MEYGLICEGKGSTFLNKTYISIKGTFLYALIGAAIYEIDINTEKFQKLGSVPEDYIKHHKYKRIMNISENKIYIWNNISLKMFIFDCAAKCGKEIFFANIPKEKFNNAFPFTVITHKKTIFFIPVISDEIIVYHKDTESHEIYISWKDELVNILSQKGLVFERVRYQDAGIYDGCVYMNISTDKRGIIAIFDCSNLKLKNIIDPKLEGNNFGILKVDDFLFLQNVTETHNYVVKWNLKSSSIQEKWEIETESRSRGELFIDGSKVVMALWDGKIFVLDIHLGNIRKISIEGELCDIEQKKTNTKIVILNKDGIYLRNVQNHSLKKIRIPELQVFINNLQL